MAKSKCVRIFAVHRSAIGFLVLALVIALSLAMPTSRADAACTVSNQISNGQVADATKVMGNFNALAGCVNSVVTSSGPPASGNLPVFTGGNTITSGNLSGDCTTSGTLAVTCTKSNGVPLSPFATGADAGQLTGTVSVNRLNNGNNADNAHFLRGDGQWAMPPGIRGSGTPPSIRASSIQSFSASSVTVTWPTSTVAGDVVIVFVADGCSMNSPGGWAILNNTGVEANNYANGITAAKVMTAADIAAGGVTVTASLSCDGVAAAVAIDGSTFTYLAEVTTKRSLGAPNVPSTWVGGLVKALDTDLVIGFTFSRGAMNPSISNFSQLQLVNTTNASAFLGRYTSTFGILGMMETATYPATNYGYYWSVVAFR